ncbi:InlB B-repeat-containing protein [Treponema sp. TIM-1]|uniref:InlB B-repeat-containing protein n=1 Tax=Treponema sp. TIM-1 TaxID=2898417 RepID=UPI00397F496B
MRKKYTGQMILSGLIVFLAFSACANSVQPTIQLYRLSYNGNGHDDGTPPQAAQAVPGARINTAVNSGYLTKAGYYFAGWNIQPDGRGASYKPGGPVSLDNHMELYAQWVLLPAEKPLTTFHAVTTGNTWYLVEGVKLVENDFCIVYGDVNENIPPDVAKNVADQYASEIYPKITGVFGEITYMPVNNGKLFLLLLDIQDGFTGGGGYVAGYFDSTHMYAFPNSNRAAMLFMDVYPGDPRRLKDFCTVVAHELQHLINFSGGKPKNTWINEGLSLAAEYIYGGEQITQRINYFNMKGTSIPYGNNFFVWDGEWEQHGYVLENYSTAYLFFRWLGIQAKGKNDIYTDIANSNHADYWAVIEAVMNSAHGFPPAFYDWKTLLATWMLANYYQEGRGFYGYKNELKDENQRKVTLTVQNIYVGGSQYSLAPGEGVFSPIPEGTSLAYAPRDNIYYIGLPESTPPADLYAAPYSGKDLLTFNGNPSEKGQPEYGYVASLGPTGMGRNAVNRNKLGPPEEPQGNYPVDFREMAKKNRPLP